MSTGTYPKPFEEWLIVKKSTHEQQRFPLFAEREIWWCRVGVNIGIEIDGKGRPFSRPVLIIKKFSRSMFLGIPTTSKTKTGTWYSQIKIEENPSNLILSQLRVFDSKRLQRRIFTIHETEFEQIKKQLGQLLEISP